MFLKKSLKLLKEKIYVLFLAELAFFFLTFFFLVFAKGKLGNYIVQLQALSAQAGVIQQGTDQAVITQFLNHFESVTNHAMWFMYFVIPLGLLIIWCATQSLVWKTLKEKTIKSFKSYFFKFCAVSVLASIFVFLILSIPVTFSVFDDVDTGILKGILALLLWFILNITLAHLGNESLKDTLKHVLRLRKKMHKLLLPFSYYLVVFLGTIYLFFALFETYITGKVFLWPLVPLTIYFILCIFILIWTKIIFQLKVEEFSKK